jgi:hypothetical protein
MKTARDFVDEIADDLSGRKGLGNEWDEIDEETQAEIGQVWEGIIRSAQSQARDEALEDAAGEVQRVWREAPNHRTDSALTSFVQNAVGPGCHLAIETIRALKSVQKP